MSKRIFLLIAIKAELDTTNFGNTVGIKGLLLSVFALSNFLLHLPLLLFCHLYSL